MHLAGKLRAAPLYASRLAQAEVVAEAFCKPSEFFLFAFKQCANSFVLLQTHARRIRRGMWYNILQK